jgi:hypothetical protein
MLQECTPKFTKINNLHQPGIEPRAQRWQRWILPLNHWCLSEQDDLVIHKNKMAYLNFNVPKQQLLINQHFANQLPGTDTKTNNGNL